VTSQRILGNVDVNILIMFVLLLTECLLRFSPVSGEFGRRRQSSANQHH